MSNSSAITKKYKGEFPVFHKTNSKCEPMKQCEPVAINKPLPKPTFNIKHRASINNEKSLQENAKKNINVTNRLTVDFESMNGETPKLIKSFKKMKHINIVSIDAQLSQKVPVGKMLPSLYNRARGLSSPHLLATLKEGQNFKMRHLRKFRSLKNLQISTGNIDEETLHDYDFRVMRTLNSSLLSLRNLQTLYIAESFPEFHQEFLEMITYQISRKPNLKKLGFYVLQTSSSYPETFNKFLGAIQNLEHLEDFQLCTNGSDMDATNMRQFCHSVSTLPHLKSSRLMILDPTITNDFVELNRIPNLNLDLLLKLSNCDLKNVQVLTQIRNQIMIRLDDVEEQELSNFNSINTLFKTLVQIPNLAQFCYTESNESISGRSKQNFAANISALAVRNFQNLKKLQLSFNDSALLEIMLGFLTKALPKMQNIEHIDLNVYQYISKSEQAKKAIAGFLTALQQKPTLKELYFSIDGQVNQELSAILVNLLPRLKQLKILGSFVLRVNPSLLYEFFSRVHRMKNLEALSVWFQPLSNDSYAPFAQKLLQNIVNGVSSIENLDYLNLRLPVPNFEASEVEELKGELKSKLKKTNVKVGSLSLDAAAY